MLFRHNVIKLCQKGKKMINITVRIFLRREVRQVDGVVGRCNLMVMFWS